MHRPLNWIVVAISLLMLITNQVMVVAPIQYASEPAAASPGMFAYVQEDGTQVYLPGPMARNVPPLSFEDVHAASGFDEPADPRNAVYTWTSPVATAERPAFQ
jgi:hypothetical protein